MTENQLQERYLFLAVVRAAREQLHLSFAEVDDRQACSPSLYLEDVLIGLNSDPDLVPRDTRRKAGATPWEARPWPVLAAKRRAYSVAELAHAQICPLRYRLTRETKTARYYRDPWQMKFLILGVLEFLALYECVKTPPKAVPDEDFAASLSNDALQSAIKLAKERFPGRPAADWFFLEREARRDLSSLGNFIKKSWSGKLVDVQAQGEVRTRLKRMVGPSIDLSEAVGFMIRRIDRQAPATFVPTSGLIREE